MPIFGAGESLKITQSSPDFNGIIAFFSLVGHIVQQTMYATSASPISASKVDHEQEGSS